MADRPTFVKLPGSEVRVNPALVVALIGENTYVKSCFVAMMGGSGWSVNATPAEVELILAGPPEPKDYLEISNTLLVSTSHITKDMAQRLENRDLSIIDTTSVYEKGEYGWWLYVQTEDDEAWPPELTALMRLARANRCEWLCLDRDGPTIEGMVTYEW